MSFQLAQHDEAILVRLDDVCRRLLSPPYRRFKALVLTVGSVHVPSMRRVLPVGDGRVLSSPGEERVGLARIHVLRHVEEDYIVEGWTDQLDPGIEDRTHPPFQAARP